MQLCILVKLLLKLKSLLIYIFAGSELHGMKISGDIKFCAKITSTLTDKMLFPFSEAAVWCAAVCYSTEDQIDIASRS